MMEEMSSIFWGLSIAVNIILVLIGLPLCLLICCCCRKHKESIEKDIKDIARNHNILQQGEEEEVYQRQGQKRLQYRQQNTIQPEQHEPSEQPRRRKAVKVETVPVGDDINLDGSIPAEYGELEE